MMEWRSIESAPRDGTEILLLYGGQTYVGRYILKEIYSHGELHSRHEGWSGHRSFMGSDIEPTHWCAIPSIPT